MQNITPFEICRELTYIYSFCAFYHKLSEDPLVRSVGNKTRLFLESEGLIVRCYVYGYRVTREGISYIVENVGCILEGDNIMNIPLAFLNLLPLERLTPFLTHDNVTVRNLTKQRVDELLHKKEAVAIQRRTNYEICLEIVEVLLIGKDYFRKEKCWRRTRHLERHRQFTTKGKHKLCVNKVGQKFIEDNLDVICEEGNIGNIELAFLWLVSLEKLEPFLTSSEKYIRESAKQRRNGTPNYKGELYKWHLVME